MNPYTYVVCPVAAHPKESDSNGQGGTISQDIRRLRWYTGIDRLSKAAIFAPTTMEVDAKGFAKLFFQQAFRH